MYSKREGEDRRESKHEDCLGDQELQLRIKIRKEQARTFNTFVKNGKLCRDTEVALTRLIQTRHSSDMTVCLKGLPSCRFPMLKSCFVV